MPVKLIKVRRSRPSETASFKHWPTHFQDVIKKKKSKRERQVETGLGIDENIPPSYSLDKYFGKFVNRRIIVTVVL